MKRKLLIIFFVLPLPINLFAQNPLLKQWDYRFGGTNMEQLDAIENTADDGFIISGTSWSQVSGDKTQPNWSGFPDCWIVKIDSIGNMQWDRRFGGWNDERLNSLHQTTDGGYILGGNSFSDSSGDKTQPGWDTTYFTSDFWIIKISASGGKQWDKRFGGDTYDQLNSIEQTADGGYMLGGSSRSGISGDKTQPNWDTNHLAYDYWIVKIDSSGNKLWDKRFGGLSSDQLFSLKQTDDGGYILGGHSISGADGDKTQPGWGSWDFWIVKTDSLGNKIWDKSFGGTKNDLLNSLQVTTDGGYILGGLSFSGISGNKSQPNWDASLMTADYWMIKIDSSGIKQWDKDFGTVGAEDEVGNISQTPDGGYLFIGSSYFPVANGNKTENNLGFEQMWVVKTSASGSIQWEKTIFTNGHDEGFSAISANYGCYVFAGYSNAGIGGYKSQPGWDTTGNTWDYWIIKFCDTTLTTGINNVPDFNYQILIYPNPFTSEISITIKKQNIGQAVFTIKNILGQTLLIKQENTFSSAYTKTIDLNELAKGIYLLEVIIDGERTVKKIVKE